MKVFYDHLCFNQDFGGVSRYFVEVISRLHKENYIHSIKFSNNHFVKTLENVNTIKFLDKYSFKGKASIIKEIGKPMSLCKMMNSNYDIYHQTHYDNYAAKLLKGKKPIVTTVHDMNFWTVPKYYKNSLKTKLNQEKSIKLADKIICISENTKNDLQNFFNISNDKIEVIHHGINEVFFQNNNNNIVISPYFLFVGARNLYKNFDGLLKAFSLLQKKYNELELVCIGSNFTKVEQRKIATLKISHKVTCKQPNDQELATYYNKALAFVFPSFYEGFGLPVLEAMASKCPLVLSDIPVFKEIAKQNAIYFNPNDENAFYHALEFSYLNNFKINLKVKKGFELAQNYTWSNSVSKHLKLYNNLI